MDVQNKTERRGEERFLLKSLSDLELDQIRSGQVVVSPSSAARSKLCWNGVYSFKAVGGIRAFLRPGCGGPTRLVNIRGVRGPRALGCNDNKWMQASLPFRIQVGISLDVLETRAVLSHRLIPSALTYSSAATAAAAPAASPAIISPEASPSPSPSPRLHDLSNTTCPQRVFAFSSSEGHGKCVIIYGIPSRT
jgi:hypothetical protein